MTRNVAICVFYDKDLNIVVQERGTHSKNGEKYGFWGGQIEEGETKDKAIIRELKEELNYKPATLEYWGNESYQITDGKYAGWIIDVEIFIAPITDELLSSKVEEGSGMAKIHIDTIIENKDHLFGRQSSERMEKLKHDLQNKDLIS